MASSWKYEIGENVAQISRPGIARARLVMMKLAMTKIPVLMAAPILEGMHMLNTNPNEAKSPATASTERKGRKSWPGGKLSSSAIITPHHRPSHPNTLIRIIMVASAASRPQNTAARLAG